MYDAIEPSAAELAAIEGTALREDECLRVRDYWAAVIAEELGAPQSPESPYVWRSRGTGEKARLRRYERRAGNTVLRLVTSDVDAAVSAPNLGEAA